MAIRKTVRHVQLAVTAEVGLHARPAALLVRLTQRFAADISIRCNDRLANAKSILSILTLGAAKGDVVKISADGPDADEAILAIKTLFASRFEESQPSPLPLQGNPNGCLGSHSRQRWMTQSAAALPAASL